MVIARIINPESTLNCLHVLKKYIHRCSREEACRIVKLSRMTQKQFEKISVEDQDFLKRTAAQVAFDVCYFA